VIFASCGCFNLVTPLIFTVAPISCFSSSSSLKLLHTLFFCNLNSSLNFHGAS
jgi:hypothetical protein